DAKAERQERRGEIPAQDLQEEQRLHAPRVGEGVDRLADVAALPAPLLAEKAARGRRRLRPAQRLGDVDDVVTALEDEVREVPILRVRAALAQEALVCELVDDLAQEVGAVCGEAAAAADDAADHRLRLLVDVQ